MILLGLCLNATRDSSEVSKDAADRLGPGTELKPLYKSQKYITHPLLVLGKKCHNFQKGY